MGKDELNVTDPAFDLADAVLQFGFSSEEEQELIRGYVKESGDDGVEARLFLQKLLAGTYAMDMALDGLRQPKLWHVANEFNEQYVARWNFLTAQTVGLLSWTVPVAARSAVALAASGDRHRRAY